MSTLSNYHIGAVLEDYVPKNVHKYIESNWKNAHKMLTVDK